VQKEPEVLEESIVDRRDLYYVTMLRLNRNILLDLFYMYSKHTGPTKRLNNNINFLFDVDTFLSFSCLLFWQ